MLNNLIKLLQVLVLAKMLLIHIRHKPIKDSGLSNDDVESWTNDDMGKFLDLFEKALHKKTNPVEEVFGDVEEKPIIKNPGASPTDKQLE